MLPAQLEKFTRQDNETWIYSKYQTAEQIVSIEAVNCEIPVSEIYRKVNIKQHDLKHNRLKIKTT